MIWNKSLKEAKVLIYLVVAAAFLWQLGRMVGSTSGLNKRQKENPNLTRIYTKEFWKEVDMAALNKKVIDWVDRWEGGVASKAIQQKEGEITNRGIRFSTFQDLAPKILGIKNPTRKDLLNITQAQWVKLVRWFWNKATFNNKIKDQLAATIMFQAFWGSGYTGLKQMQKALNLPADGIVGSKTVKKINNTKNAGKILEKALIDYYNYLGKSPRYSFAVKGWLNRMSDLPKFRKASIGLPLILILGGWLIYKPKLRS